MRERHTTRNGGRALAAALATLALAACATPPTGELIGSTHGLEYELVERAPGHVGGLPLVRGAEVDRNSTIAVEFSGFPSDDRPLVAVDPLWDAIERWIVTLEDLVVEGAAIDEELARAPTGAAFERLLARIEAFDGRIFDAQDTGVALAARIEPGLSADIDEAVEWLDQLPGDDYLDRLANYFSGRLAARKSEIEGTIRRSDRVEVLVSAFAGRGEERTRLHVRNYDSIASAEPTVARRSGLDLSGRERARLLRELEQSRRAAKVLAELDERVDALLDGTADLGDAVSRAVEGLAAGLESFTADFGATDPNLSPLARTAQGMRVAGEQLGNIADGVDDDAGADALRALSRSLIEASDAARAVDDAVRESRELLRLDLTRSLLAILDGDTELSDRAYRVVGASRDALARLEAVGTALTEASRSIGRVDAAVTVGVARAVTPDAVASELDAWLSEVRPWLELLRAIGGRLDREPQEIEIAQAAIAADRSVNLPRTLDDLRDGEVFLGENVEVGDAVVVVVQVLDADGTELDRTDFPFRVTRFGIRREIHGEAIFARGDSGPDTAQRWKPNVAAMASWHYRYRRPTTDWGRFVNWLDPGIGIHAASLDQDVDEGAEFGIGVQARFFDGLLFVGAGSNLSVDEDRTYYFVGTDLFKLLGELSD